MLIIRGSGSGTTKVLPNLIEQQNDVDYSVIDIFHMLMKQMKKSINISLKTRRQWS